MKLPVVSDRLVLQDQRGVLWRRDESYQDQRPNAEGWLALRSDEGQVLGFGSVVDLYGFPRPNDRPYLKVLDGTYP